MRKLLTLLIALAAAASVWASAFAGWQSRDSNYNISISSGGGGASLSLSIPSGTTSGSVTGTPTMPQLFTGIGIGTAAADRIVGVGISYSGVAANPNSELVITANSGAITFTKGSGVITSGRGFGLGVWFALIPSGTTIDLSINNVGGTGYTEPDGFAFQVFNLNGSATASVASTNYTADYGVGVSSISTSGAITIPTGGIAIMVGDTHPTTGTVTWVNATNDAQYVDAAGDILALAHTITSGNVVTMNAINATGEIGFSVTVFQP
jgi:hypothetical protein